MPDVFTGERFEFDASGMKFSKMISVQPPTRSAQGQNFATEDDQNSPFGWTAGNAKAECSSYTITRAYNDEEGFNEWWKLVEEKSADAKKDATCILMDPEGNPLKTYTFTGSVPISLGAPTVSAQDPSVITETMTLDCETFAVE